MMTVSEAKEEVGIAGKGVYALLETFHSQPEVIPYIQHTKLFDIHYRIMVNSFNIRQRLSHVYKWA